MPEPKYVPITVYLTEPALKEALTRARNATAPVEVILSFILELTLTPLEESNE